MHIWGLKNGFAILPLRLPVPRAPTAAGSRERAPPGNRTAVRLPIQSATPARPAASVMQSRQPRNQQGKSNGDAAQDCFHVRVQGIAWYVGRRHAHPGERKAFLRHEACWQHAVQLLHGDAKILQSQGFARKRPQRGKELLSEGAALFKARPMITLASSVHASRHGAHSCMHV